VKVKLGLSLVWYAFVCAKLDWDVACFNAAFRDTVTEVVTS
jgi:hypothetical protein